MKKLPIRQPTRTIKRVTKEQKESRSKHVLFEGNPRTIRASREALGAVKYKAE